MYNDKSLTGFVFLNDADSLSAVVAALLALGLIKFLPQKVELHLSAAQVGLLTVVQDGVECMDVFVLS